MTSTFMKPAPRPTYDPGKAQSTQTQSQGTPYGQLPATGSMAGVVKDQNQAWANSKGYNQQPSGPSAAPQSAPKPSGVDMSSYKPGQAQPVQQSLGTPYGQLPATGSPATSYADAWNAAMPKGGNGVTFTPARSVIGAGAGNMAYAQPGQRPEGFVTQSYDPQGNPVTQGQQAQQRDAFVSQILQAPRDTPQYDFQGMMGKANDMVKDGWQNPFNFNQPQTPSPGPQSPQGVRYTPVEPVSNGYGVSYQNQQLNAGRFISELERANPNTWTDQQWADYQQAKRDQGIEDSGGYYRGQDGKVYRSDGYTTQEDADRLKQSPIGSDAQRDQYGTWHGGQPNPSSGTAQPTQTPALVPQAPPGGQPSSPGVQGRPDNRMAIQDLFTKNNIQAPQGFIDQLIARLGGGGRDGGADGGGGSGSGPPVPPGGRSPSGPPPFQAKSPSSVANPKPPALEDLPPSLRPPKPAKTIYDYPDSTKYALYKDGKLDLAEYARFRDADTAAFDARRERDRPAREAAERQKQQEHKIAERTGGQSPYRTNEWRLTAVAGEKEKVDAMKAQVANLWKNWNKGSLDDRRAKEAQIKRLQQGITNMTAWQR